jgi:hypothetical protein
MATQQAPFPPDVVERMNEALAALRARGVHNDYCPRCGTDNWNVDFVGIPCVPLPQQGLNIPPNTVLHLGIRSSSGYIPALTVACANCGYLMLHNLNTLGLWKG